jgi:hypothetical protein
MPQAPVEIGIGAKPAVPPEHRPLPLGRGQAQHPLHRGDCGAQASLTGLVPGIDQGYQALMVLRGAYPGELPPATVFFPLK